MGVGRVSVCRDLELNTGSGELYGLFLLCSLKTGYISEHKSSLTLKKSPGGSARGEVGVVIHARSML